MAGGFNVKAVSAVLVVLCGAACRPPCPAPVALQCPERCPAGPGEARGDYPEAPPDANETGVEAPEGPREMRSLDTATRYLVELFRSGAYARIESLLLTQPELMAISRKPISLAKYEKKRRRWFEMMKNYYPLRGTLPVEPRITRVEIQDIVILGPPEDSKLKRRVLVGITAMPCVYGEHEKQVDPSPFYLVDTPSGFKVSITR